MLCNLQLSKLSVHPQLDEYVKTLFHVCPDMSPYPTEHTPICILHRAEPRGGEEETESIKREAKRDRGHSFVLSAVYKRSICLNCKVKVKSLSHVQLFATPWTVAYQAPLSIGFSREEYWSGLSFPSPGDLPNPGTEPRSPTL